MSLQFLISVIFWLLAASPSACFTILRDSRTNLWQLHHGSDDDHDCKDSAQVGDYVKGLHGGKYQFEQLGTSMEAQDFVESMYSGGDAMEEVEWTMPEWAKNIALPNEDYGDYETLEFGNDEFVSLHLENEEPTWGAYYAQVQHATLTDCPFYVNPSMGQLAPRTGSVEISVQPIEECTIDNGWWLILSTEEMNMFYKLVKR